MFSYIKGVTLAVIAVAAGKALAETHTITFANNCGFGTPTLISQNGAVLSTGGAYTANAPIIGAIAYLQTGNCGFNGDNCIIVETTLKNPDPTKPGSGSSTDLSLIPPHAFQITTGFRPVLTCPTAFFTPNDTWVQVPCQADNANLVITFCL
ncbi:Glycopeptide [Mycena sanguinolenta]|uniref:Glycopeptide n=1 Tax=Mycena sanguinolenta TaxID=230812 RepID=A0A8H7CB78_9AGAR|nr:Glycopeptide [Mycena sanguinolenta]